MVQYKLYYFSFKGLAEPIRLLFTYADVKFEDVRIPQDDWHRRKSEMPMGQMPVLEVDGKKLTQAVAIGRYVAEQHGLLPKDPWQRAKADELVLAWTDYGPKLVSVLSQPTIELKRLKFQEVLSDFVYPRLRLYDDYFSNSTSGLIADKVCWADYFIYNFIQLTIHFWHPKMDKYANVKKFLEMVENIPETKSFIMKYKAVAIAPMSPAEDLGM